MVGTFFEGGLQIRLDAWRVKVFPTSFLRQPPVPEGGQLSITAGGMTEGNETCG